MKLFLKHGLLGAVVLPIAMTAGTSAFADSPVEASVGVSNLYLFRGDDLGDGSAQVWGDLSASYQGLYGGIWASSGDDALGTEYDLYAGYGGEVSDFSYDILFTNYIYPDTVGTNTPQNFGDFTEVAATIGYGPVSFTQVKTIAGGSGSTYRTLSYEHDKYSATYGDFLDKTKDSHLDLSYAYNDRLSFTVSFAIDADEGDSQTRDPLVVFSYTLPLE